MTRLTRRTRYAVACALWRLADGMDGVGLDALADRLDAVGRWLDPRPKGVRR